LDPTPIKDIARSLRFVAEVSGRTLRKTLPLDALPDPAARVAESALSALLKVGREAERGASKLAHTLLDRTDLPPPLADATEAEAEASFTAAAHEGLRAALALLGAETSLVSESAMRRAWRTVIHAGSGHRDSATAAALFTALEQAQVLRDAVWNEDALPAPEAERIATFALLLAMLADHASYQSALPAAVDIALAIRQDIAAADRPDRLESLFDEFRDHV
jgi:hypothetical protein